jgi:ribosomal protein S18 acetylase RimI-like enzyme
MFVLKIELTTKPDSADLEILSQGIQSYNQQFMSDDIVFEGDTRFAVFARDDNNNVIGGIRANAFWNYCIIELVWLSYAARGLGLGKKLMQQAENFALKQGFSYMRVETLNVQAKPFYEKLGYKVFGTLNDYPEGFSTYCLVKKIK